jgi:hypothetical protein
MNPQNMPFGTYTDKILELANSTFAPLYHKIFKHYWHDGSFMAKMTQNYTTTDWQNGIFETYIPTQDADHGLSYYRIAIKIVPAINNKTFHEEAQALRRPLHLPPGIIDSELQIVISQRLDKWGFIRAFNHTPQKTKGYLSAIYITNRREKASSTCQGGKLIVTPPEVLWVKITRGICEFLNKRITALLKALKLERWQIGAKDNNTLYYTCIQSAIFSRYGHSLRLTVMSLSHTLDNLLHKIWSVQEDIGNQSLAKRAIKPLLGLSPDKLAEVFVYIRQELQVDLKRSVSKLNPHEVQLLEVYRHG